MDLKRATGDVRLIFLEEKQIAFEKRKGEGMQAHVYER